MGTNKGILMHISSLPSPYGIGNLGKEAYEFVDFLEKIGHEYWQILPQNPTGFGDSPYQSASAFAGNPYFIDIDALVLEGLLKKHEVDNYFFGKDPERVDYGKIFFYRYPLLRCAYFRFTPNDDYIKFTEKNAWWLDKYSLFMALKEANHYQSWVTWEDDLKDPESERVKECKNELKKIIDFYKFVQFKFFEEWERLKNYANQKGIKIIGDLPIYVAMDSAEVWAERELFEIDENNAPKSVAAYPPDKTYKCGQVWGNPLYNWKKMKKQNYEWWQKRFLLAQEMYDVIRIDHFAGFFKYYSVAENASDALGAAERRGPGEDLFDKVIDKLKIDVIAENMGVSSRRMDKAIEKYGFYGMNLLELEIDFNEGKWNKPKKDASYTGNHDTDTLMGWYESLSENKKRTVRRIFGIKRGDDVAKCLINAVLEGQGAIKIIPIQDYLKAGSSGRMNTPSTVGGNWLYRVKKEDLDRLKKEL